jgi:hypothetical protein
MRRAGGSRAAPFRAAIAKSIDRSEILLIELTISWRGPFVASERRQPINLRLSQKRKCPGSRGTSVLPSGGDIVSLPRHVRLVPKSEARITASASKRFASVPLALALQDFAASLPRRVAICSTDVGTSVAGGARSREAVIFPRKNGQG